MEFATRRWRRMRGRSRALAIAGMAGLVAASAFFASPPVAADAAPAGASGATLPVPSLAGTPVANWIWNTTGAATSTPTGTIYLRKTFTVTDPSAISSAVLVINADDESVNYVNGVEVSSNPAQDTQSSLPTGWASSSVVNIKSLLVPGTNVIAITASNSAFGGGVIAAAEIGSTRIVTDGTWKALPGTPASPPAGWDLPGFDDSSWPAADVTGPYGIAPWGSFSLATVVWQYTSPLSISKPALLMQKGGTDQLSYQALAPDGNPQVIWSSSDGRVASVDQSGTVTAVGPGKAEIRLTSPLLHRTVSIPVQVENHVVRMGQNNILISVYWPPTGAQYVNQTQYRYLGQAGIDDVAGNDTLGTKAINMKMAALAYKNGLYVTVDDNSFPDLPNLSDAQIDQDVEQYTDVPGVGGFFLVDEPPNPVPYERVINDIEQVAPGYDPHLNFTSGWSAQDLADYAEAVHSQGYLMFDDYPFGLTPDSMDYSGFMTELNRWREVGLATGMKTGTYLQSIGLPGGFARPTPTEIRYEANLVLAYGFKQLSYFTWFTPTNRSQTFTNAIMTADGQKTDLYDPVKHLDSQIHALGRTLVKLDAEQVWMNGDTYGQVGVPVGAFVHAGAGEDLTLSYLRNPVTGRNYLMVVNNNFTAAQDADLTFSDGIGSVQVVSSRTGNLGKPIELAGGQLTQDLGPGGAVLYALPVGFDFSSYPSLSAAYDTAGVSDDASPASGNLDGSSDSYSAEALTAAGVTPGGTITHDGLTFTFPSGVGTPDSATADGQTFALSGSGSTLGFIGADDDGPATGTGTITYTDGTTQPFTLSFADWWANTAASGGDIVATMPYINTASGRADQEVSLYYDSVPLEAGKTVKSVTLPTFASSASGNPVMHIFAAAIGSP